MQKVSILLPVFVGLLVVASACAQQPPETPSHQETGALRVEVSRHGFNKSPGEFRLEVEEGQEVEITFVYGDGDFSQNNPHTIIIPDYGITTGILDENNREETVRFIAKGHGEVTFMCAITDCVGHTNLLGGIVDVHGEDDHEAGEQHN